LWRPEPLCGYDLQVVSWKQETSGLDSERTSRDTVEDVATEIDKPSGSLTASDLEELSAEEIEERL